MPISTTDQLFTLIKSMTKAEKRSFKLYAKRTQTSSEAKFVKLFDIIDKQDTYSEATVFKKFGKLSKGQLSNLKRHLYSQILSSLRLIHISKNKDIQIREQIDYAQVLYGKGLYMQSLKLLNRVKGIASGANEDILHFEILEFEKLIEERHITRSRSIKNKVETLLTESQERIDIIYNACQLTNLKIRIHGMYIKIGHAKNEKEAFVVQDYFQSNLPKLKYSDLTFLEKVYLDQAFVWYYYILLDFENCYKRALNWVTLFDQNEQMKDVDPDLYLRGVHYVLTSLFGLGDVKNHDRYLKKFDNFWKEYSSELNTTSEMIYFLYSSTAFINNCYLQGDYEAGLAKVPEIEEKLEYFNHLLDLHRVLVFHYRIAWLHFGNGDYDQAIDYLNKIIQLKAGHLREDIQCYSRILHLLCHFEEKNYILLEYLEKSVSRFIDKMEEKNQVQSSIISFIRKQVRTGKLLDKKLLTKLKKDLKKLQKDPYEKRAFIYMDIIPWIESKLTGKSMQQIVQEWNKV